MAIQGYRVDGLRVARERQRILDRGRPLTQAAFASRLGIHWVTMSRIENGKTNVSLDLVERIAHETGKPRDYFLSDDEDEEDEEAAPMSRSLVADLLQLAQLASLLERNPDLIKELA